MKISCCSKPHSTTAGDDEVPVDRGWAWVIALASAGLFCLIAGTFKCIGILKLEYEKNFPECKKETIMWSLSASSIVSLLSGPAFGWMVNKTSHRVVGMIGGTLCSIGIFLTAFSRNCHFLFFSFSLVYSVGTGGVMVVTFSAFSDYFSKHRGLAVGVMASGSGLGGLIIPKLLRYLFDTYSFRETLICYAGVFLQSIILAALLRPSSHYKKGKKRAAVPDILITSDESPSNGEDGKLLKPLLLETEIKNFTEHSPSISSIEKSDLLLIEESCPRDDSLDKVTFENENNNKISLEYDDTALQTQEFTPIYGSVYSLFSAPFTSTLSIHDLDNANKQVATKTNRVTTNTSSTNTNSNDTTAKYNWSLWYERQVVLIGIVVLFAVGSINLIFQTTPSLAIEYGVDIDQVTTIMTIASSCEIFFRMLHGWFADKRICSALTQVCAIMLSCTIGTILCATLHGIAGISIMYGVMSLCGTTIFSLLPIVIIEQIGKDSLETVLGITYVYQAAAFIISTQVATFLQGKFDTWIYVFYYIGANYFLATLIAIFTYLYPKLSAKKIEDPL